MDEISAFNQSKWDELVRSGVLYGRPLLDLTPASASAWLEPTGRLPDVRGRDVLCLASGGGKQSAAFGVLGANVHVLDLSPAMLEGDRQAAAHYGYPADVQQGDMRDLSRYPDRSFDIIWQAYSINFIPDPRPVFDGVARLLRPGGLYHLQFHNPYFAGMDENEWTAAGYPIRLPYLDGVEIEEPVWEFDDEHGNIIKTRGPRAFRHTLSSLLNGLLERGFILRQVWEEVGQDPTAAPGTWDHFLRVAPPWLTTWFEKT